MGCDSSVRASTVQLLVLCLWLQHISVSLSAPSAISSRNSNGINDNNNNRNRNHKDSASEDRDEDRVVNLLRITRDDRSQQRRKYEDYSDDVVSI